MKYAVVATLAAGVSAAVYGTPSSVPYEPVPYSAPHPSYESAPYGTPSSYGYAAPTGAPSYTTKVVTAYTTYCPEATQITHGGKTYTVTSATTLTITDCPCTVSYPVYTHSTTSCSTTTVETTTPCPTSSTSPYSPPAVSYPPGHSTYTTAPVVSTVPYTGGANQVAPGVAALLGLAAYLL